MVYYAYNKQEENILEIEVTPKKKEILAKHGLTTKEDLLKFFPYKYKDYTTVYTELTPELDGKEGCFVGVFSNLKSSQTANKCTCVSYRITNESGQKISVSNFGKKHLLNALAGYDKVKVAVCGKIKYDKLYGYTISDPDELIRAEYLHKVQGVMPVYKKFAGISAEAMNELVKDALATAEYREWDNMLAQEFGFGNLPSLRSAINMLHSPKDMSAIDKGQYRVDMSEMYDFLKQLSLRNKEDNTHTFVELKTFKKSNELKHMLPYSLTEDQDKAGKSMLLSIMSHKRVSALLQGDVGCGKTIVAIMMLVIMAENGYQGVIMAPTAILAKQHYRELKEYADKLGFTVDYYDGQLKAAEKKDILNRLASGELSILVGTQAICSADPEFKNLGIAIIDEEQRFGVEQKEVLTKYAKQGVNTLLMSATPMPRSLAGSLYGNGMEIYDIHTKPSCRIPVQTAINNSDEKILDFIEKQLREGRQAYVVCPLIETNEDCELMKDVVSVNSRCEQYKARFEPEFRVEMLNGKMKEEELNAVIEEFRQGNIHILISTTVIEVGVNNPNASVMVISNAERYGLAAMHQLRGRVGRGSYKSYCILQSKDRNNERLQALVTCTDGFAIAEEDLKLRGGGELIGLKQSGFTKQLDLIMKYEDEHRRMQAFVDAEIQKDGDRNGRYTN